MIPYGPNVSVYQRFEETVASFISILVKLEVAECPSYRW